MAKLARNLPILITGSGGGLGKAVLACLQREGFTALIAPSKQELDLLNQDAIHHYLSLHRPKVIIHLASLVFGLGGNLRNQTRATIENTLMHAYFFGALREYPPERIFFAGTVASYPFPYATLPLVEDCFFAGLPHTGEFGYAMAKRHAYTYLSILEKEVGLQYTYGILTNLYGAGDRFDVENGHVVPSLIAKAYVAAQTDGVLEVWGNGEAERDFLHFEDAARAIIFCLEHDDVSRLINIASGEGISIGAIAQMIAEIAAIKQLNFALDKPVGITKRIVDNTQLKQLGFSPSIPIGDGLKKAYNWYVTHLKEVRHE